MTLNRVALHIIKRLEACSVSYHIDGPTLAWLEAGGEPEQAPKAQEIAISCEDAESLKGLVRTCRLRGWRVVIERHAENGRAWSRGDINKLVFRRRRMSGRSRIKERAIVYLKYPEGSHLYWNRAGIVLRVPAESFSGLSAVTVGGLSIPIPGDVQEYLGAFGVWKERVDKCDLAGKAQADGREMLLDVTSTLEQLGVEYHLEGGTLLGLVRDGKLIPWDHDLDISIPASAVVGMSSAVWRLRRRGWMVSKRFFSRNGVAWEEGQVRIMRIRARKWLVLRGELCLDVFVKYPMNDYVWWQAKGKVMRVPAFHYQGHTTVMLEGVSLRAPVDAERYLEAKYGDWRTPRMDWDCAFDERTIVSS